MPANLFDLTGRVALVTGGNKGLGKAMARGFAEAGADVVIASRHEDELKSALDFIIEGTGRRGAYCVTDVSVREEVKKLAQFASHHIRDHCWAGNALTLALKDTGAVSKHGNRVA